MLNIHWSINYCNIINFQFIPKLYICIYNTYNKEWRMHTQGNFYTSLLVYIIFLNVNQEYPFMQIEEY